MSPSDREVFCKSMTLLAETLSAELSDFGMEGYWYALKDLSVDQLTSAVQTAMKSCRFFPKPMELREYAFGVTLEDRVEIGWQAWRRAAKTVGSYRSLVLVDSALGDALVACFGGWVEACTTELSPEMWASKRKEFERVFRAMTTRADPTPRYLRGTFEMTERGRAECGLINGTTIQLLTPTETAQWVERLTSSSPGLTAIAAAVQDAALRLGTS